MLYTGCMKTGKPVVARKENEIDGAEELFYVQNRLAKRVRHCECSEGAPLLNPWRAENGEVVFCCAAREIRQPKGASILDYNSFLDVLSHYRIDKNEKTFSSAYKSYLLEAFVKEILHQLRELDGKAVILREKLNVLTSKDEPEIGNTRKELNDVYAEADKLRSEAAMFAERKALESPI